MEKLLGILKEIRPDVEFGTARGLVDDGVLTSFDIIDIVTDINLAFDVSIGVADLTPDNFNSAEAMMALIESL
jgi:acyl carrier protein